MRHKTFQKWLHLNRSGELSSRQAARLERHLHHCEACAGEKLKIQQANQLLAIARDTTPQPENPQVSIDKIMDSIDHRFERSTGKNQRWLDWLGLPQLRFALVTVVLVTMGVFVYQGTMILHRISMLEQRMSAQTEHRGFTGKILSKIATRAAMIRGLDDAEHITNDLPDDRVVISRSTLMALLDALKRQYRDDDRLIQHLLEELSLFNGTGLSRGIKKKELRKFLEKKQDIVQLIERI